MNKLLNGVLFLAMLMALISCGGSPSNVQTPVGLKSIAKFELGAQVIWSRNIGSIKSTGGRFQLAESSGHLYVASESGQVTALDGNSGNTLWEIDLARQISSGASMEGSLIGLSTRDGSVIALSANDGAIKWSTNVAGEVLSVPAFGNGIMVVQTVDGRVMGLSAGDGKILWKYERNVPSLSLRGSSGPILVQGLIVAGFASGHIVGLDSRNGRVVWEVVVAYPSGRSDIDRLADVDAPAVISGTTLFAASYQGKIIAIDLRNGQQIWSRPLSVYLPFSVDKNNLYVANEDGVVMALNKQTGGNVWAQNDLKARTSTQPVVVSGAVIVGDVEGYLHILDADDGRIVGRRSLDGSHVLSHLLVGNRVYTSTAQGKILAYTVKAL